MEDFFEMTFELRPVDCGIGELLRPSALLGCFQDVATAHADLLGSHRDYLLREHHGVWLLGRVWFRLERPLYMGDQLAVRTWQRHPRGPMVYRDYDLFLGGEPVGEGVSTWVVADLDSRKILRLSDIPPIAGAPVPAQVKERQLKPIRTDPDRTLAYTKVIRWSDLDLNGHMNNTKYADVALDALPLDALSHSYPAEMQINYSQECMPGESLTVSLAEHGTAYYVDGCGADGARHFEASLRLQAL